MASAEELKPLVGCPVPLLPNTYQHFYNGGKLRSKFMGEAEPKDDYNSEEWIFSTNVAVTPGRDNWPTKGMSIIHAPNGEVILLEDLLKAYPNETLGKKHYDKFGAKLGVLMKIFDVGEGAHIPVHWHPSPEFSKKHLNSDFGKNECWIVIDTRPGVKSWVGFKEDVKREDFKEWMDKQDIQAMRDAMYEIEPKAGDVVFLTDGWIHSLGEGMCVLEPQEPTDWNLLAEWEGYPYERKDAFCGLDEDLALDAAKFEKMPEDYLNNYVRRTPETLREENGNIEAALVPDEAKKYFYVTKFTIQETSGMSVPAGRGFHCLTPVNGQGVLRYNGKECNAGKSHSLFIPAGMGAYSLVNTGSDPLEIVCCFPPKV